MPLLLSLLAGRSFFIKSPSSRAELLLCTLRGDSREVSLALQLFCLEFELGTAANLPYVGDSFLP